VVRLGRSDDAFVEIVDGLAAGERVFLNPRAILGNGPPVEREPEQAAAVAVGRSRLGGA